MVLLASERTRPGRGTRLVRLDSGAGGVSQRRVTPETAALLDLVETLSKFGRDDSLVGSDWLEAMVAEFLSAPGLQDLDPFMYDALLTWAGFDLNDAESLSCAARLTALLLGAEAITIRDPGGGEQHPVRELADSDDLEDCRQFGAEYAESDEANECYTASITRGCQYVRDYYLNDDENEDPDDLPHAA